MNDKQRMYIENGCFDAKKGVFITPFSPKFYYSDFLNFIKTFKLFEKGDEVLDSGVVVTRKDFVYSHNNLMFDVRVEEILINLAREYVEELTHTYFTVGYTENSEQLTIVPNRQAFPKKKKLFFVTKYHELCLEKPQEMNHNNLVSLINHHRCERPVETALHSINIAFRGEK